MACLEMFSSHFLRQKTDPSKLATGKITCQRNLVRILVLFSATACLESVSIELTPWKFALERPLSVVLQYIGTVPMGLLVRGMTPVFGFIAELIVQDLVDAP